MKKNHTIKTSVFLASIAMLALSSAKVLAATFINDNFTGAVRVSAPPSVTGVDRDGGTSNDYVVATNGNGPMATSNPAITDYASNVVSGINGNSYQVINAAAAYSVQRYFTATTLADGETMTLSLNIRAAGTPSAGVGAFRLGLFDTASVLAANTSNFGGGGAFTGATGYLGSYQTNAGSGNAGLIQERTNGVAANNLFQGTLASGTTATGSNVVAANTNYVATLTLARSGANVDVTSSFNGVNLSYTDTSGAFTFDTVGIFFGSTFGSSGIPYANFIDDVNLSVVPEPATWALLAFSLTTVMVLRRRRAA
jgi:hypothetical protein